MLAAWATAIVLAGLAYLAWPRTIDVHAENGPLEYAQLGVWALAVLVAAAATLRAPSLRDRLGAVWLGVLAALCTLREMDLHEWVQHQNSWLPPVHFRIDWITSPDVPLWPKVFWLGVFAAVGLALCVPPLIVRAPGARLLRAGDGATWLLLISVALLAMGYLSDDVLGRGRIGLHIEVTQGIEEQFETYGGIAFLLAAWCELRVPLSERLRRLDARGA